MSSLQGGSPGAEQHGPIETDTITPQTENNSPNDRSSECRWRTTQYNDAECARFFDCPSHSVPRSTPEEQHMQQTGRDGHRSDDENDVTNPTTENEGEPAERPDTDRLASQLSLLGAGLGSSREETLVNRDTDDGASPTAAHQAATALLPTALLPPRSISDVVPVQRPLNLDHSLPPTPREEHPSQELPSPSPRSDRQRSTVAFQEHGDGQSSLSRSSVTHDYNLERQGSFPNPTTASRRVTQLSPPGVQELEGRAQPEFVLPRWQPDAEVTYCPICQTQFSIFVRKHHCRKCGRVVCNSCSPHRIIIPHQYIVRPPGSEIPPHPGYMYEGLAGGYLDDNGPAGGERVRLCNPCVPDPQTAPPQSPNASAGSGSSRAAHQRSRSSFGSGYGSVSSNRYPGAYVEARGSEQWRGYSARTRSITVVPGGRAGSGGSSSRAVHSGSLQRLSQPGSSYPARHSSLISAASSSRNRMLPPTPQIAEEDECPICHRELPSREIPNFEAAREAHINSCILSHSTYGSPRTPAAGGNEQPAPTPAVRRTGMYKYVATEKDCIDDAECTICLEEFTVGVGMARLECLCRFHRSCISAWFVNHPGRCPVHQHDGFGF